MGPNPDRGAREGANVAAVSGTAAWLSFDATIVAPPRGQGALVVLPDHAATIFGTRARIPVRATFNGVPYRGSVMPLGDGIFGLGLTKAVRAEVGVGMGDLVHVVVERDDEERTVEVPDDLVIALRAAGLEDRFAGLAFTHRREYVNWITDAKRDTTRAQRVAKTITTVGDGKALS
jgi:hypothetical protein